MTGGAGSWPLLPSSSFLCLFLPPGLSGRPFLPVSPLPPPLAAVLVPLPSSSAALFTLLPPFLVLLFPPVMWFPPLSSSFVSLFRLPPPSLVLLFPPLGPFISLPLIFYVLLLPVAVDRMMGDPDQGGETGPEVGKLGEWC